MDYDALAKQFGAKPLEQQSGIRANDPPFMADLPLKTRHEIYGDMYKEGRERLNALNQRISDAGVVLDDLREFGRLNRRTATGSVWNQITPDWPMLRSNDAWEMLGIHSRLGPALHKPGTGPMTDKDVVLNLRGLPRIDVEGPVNAAIREDFERKYNYAVAKRDAMQDHLEKHGHLYGFDTEFANRMKQPSNSATSNVANQQAPRALPQQEKVMTLADIQETSRRSGRTTAEVTAEARAQGYRIVGSR